MKYLILIIAGILGIWVGRKLAMCRTMNKGSTVGKGNLMELNEAKKIAKEKNKEKILELLKEKDQITNNDIESALGVSDATATRYFEELEQEGKIIQKGEGRGVYYIKT
ncbi:MAG TPA: ArsR family transcriptional regulator [Candidatus Wolfebacteria bacterium]|nr:ArsR family transcriptional regulator [Candidatus Wolfebacteria bacterium]